MGLRQLHDLHCTVVIFYDQFYILEFLVNELIMIHSTNTAILIKFDTAIAAVAVIVS